MEKRISKICLISALTVAPGVVVNTSTAYAKTAETTKSGVAGSHDFDFEFGNWKVHHKLKRPGGEWIEFEGTSSDRGLNEGRPTWKKIHFTGRRATRKVSPCVRSKRKRGYGRWWVDSRDPHAALDPPAKVASSTAWERFTPKRRRW